MARGWGGRHGVDGSGLSNTHHAPDAIAVDADAIRTVLAVDAIPAEPSQLALADAVAAESNAVSADTVEFPAFAANAVADTIVGTFNPESADTVAAAA